jgi:hypothetical protein
MRRERRRRKRDQFEPLILRRQRDVLRDVMLSAGQCGRWLTLRELARLTRYGEASISAQLRHLRKPEYGAFVLDKRRREEEEVGRIAEQGPLWEYRLRGGARTKRRRSALSKRLIKGMVRAAKQFTNHM